MHGDLSTAYCALLNPSSSACIRLDLLNHIWIRLVRLRPIVVVHLRTDVNVEVGLTGHLPRVLNIIAALLGSQVSKPPPNFTKSFFFQEQ